MRPGVPPGAGLAATVAWYRGNGTAAGRGAGTLLPGMTASALLAANGNVIGIIELAAAADLPLPVLRAATRAVSADQPGLPRVEGVLFLYPRHRRGLRMVFFDRDGTWEALCGNGLRCVTRYAADQGLFTGAGEIVTDDGIRAVSADGARVTVTVGPAREVRQVGENRWFAYTGIPHLVVFVPGAAALDRIDVPRAGARLRYDSGLCRGLGHPEGVHVDFAAVEGPRALAIRTYEAGVEDETRCCGTGAVATACLAETAGRARLPCQLRSLGGIVEVGRAGDGQLTLSGNVEYLVPRRPVTGMA